MTVSSHCSRSPNTLTGQCRTERHPSRRPYPPINHVLLSYHASGRIIQQKIVVCREKKTVSPNRFSIMLGRAIRCPYDPIPAEPFPGICTGPTYGRQGDSFAQEPSRATTFCGNSKRRHLTHGRLSAGRPLNAIDSRRRADSPHDQRNPAGSPKAKNAPKSLRNPSPGPEERRLPVKVGRTRTVPPIPRPLVGLPAAGAEPATAPTQSPRDTPTERSGSLLFHSVFYSYNLL